MATSDETRARNGFGLAVLGLIVLTFGVVLASRGWDVVNTIVAAGIGFVLGGGALWLKYRS